MLQKGENVKVKTNRFLDKIFAFYISKTFLDEKIRTWYY